VIQNANNLKVVSKSSPKNKHICNSHKLTHYPKIAKELGFAITRTKRHCSKNERKMTREINNETPTKAICNKGFRGNSSILPRIKFRVGGHIASTVSSNPSYKKNIDKPS